MAVEQKVREIICEQLSVEESEVKREASFVETLNADSLDIVELIMAFEEAFEIEIPDEDAERSARWATQSTTSRRTRICQATKDRPPAEPK